MQQKIPPPPEVTKKECSKLIFYIVESSGWLDSLKRIYTTVCEQGLLFKLIPAYVYVGGVGATAPLYLYWQCWRRNNWIGL